LIDTANLDGRAFALLGPMKLADPARTPVRGDLAHIGLAGRYFVPHYAVPQPRKIAAGGTALRDGSCADAETLAQLPGGSAFDVLDIAGRTAWGQAADQAGKAGGLVGYVALDGLEETS
jgi:hypothetical protein